MQKREIRRFFGMSEREFETWTNGLGFTLRGRLCSTYNVTVYPNTTSEEAICIKTEAYSSTFRYFLHTGKEIFRREFSRGFITSEYAIKIPQLDDSYYLDSYNHPRYMLHSDFENKVGIDTATGRYCMKSALVEIDGELVNKYHQETPSTGKVIQKNGEYHLAKNYIKVESNYDIQRGRFLLVNYHKPEEVETMLANGEITLCEATGVYELTEYMIELNTETHVKYSSKYVAENYFKCPDCNTYHLLNEAKLVRYGRNNVKKVCENCLSDYILCADGYYYSRQEVVEVEGQIYTDDDMRSEILSYHHFDRSNYTFHSLDGERTDMYFGTELEMETPDRNAAYVLYGKCNDIFHLERDGSIIGGGFEMISQPLSLPYLKSRAEDIKELFANLRNHGAKGHDATRACCGFHIHVSRKAFKDEDAVKRASVIINNFQTECEKLARRKNDHYYTYSRVNGIVTKEKVCLSSGHCYAVNNQNRHTVEFRIFRSTLNLETYIGSVEFIRNVVEAANKGATRISFSQLLVGDYLPAYVEDLNARREAKMLDKVNFDAVVDLQGYYQNDLLKILSEKKMLEKQIIEFNNLHPERKIKVSSRGNVWCVLLRLSHLAKECLVKKLLGICFHVTLMVQD